MPGAVSEAELARSLEGGFVSRHADIGGVRLHYVEGGHGDPLLLLGGWPQTWWQFHKIMPALAEHFRVIAVDLRGMGGSDKPAGGYGKKAMAADIRGLVGHLGHDAVHIAGHDIGGMVAYAFAANHPELTGRVALLDIAPPDDRFFRYSLLPVPGRHQVDGDIHAGPGRFLWWFAFNQVPDLPERLLAGRARLLIDWMIDYLAADPAALTDHDRDVYARAYSSDEAIRAGNAWYRALPQDIADGKTYAPLSAPVLALGGGEGTRALLEPVLAPRVTDLEIVEVPDSGHYIAEEQPEAVVGHFLRFFRDRPHDAA
ncbi:hydrolase [Streptomyces nigrescens]|uniref:Hydrolase n=1 Tax=Streptomyces nigrescens TaxID=1920 RepID=A0ABM7ZTB4_STRNI|nr:alpha/beta hydrolase [Streptomyces nigrescens]BDM69607.1 hydrolase [Streptomyces nigrescens]